MFLKRWVFRGHLCFTNTSCFFYKMIPVLLQGAVWGYAALCDSSSCFFSSPEHKVLMVSFCDRPMSGVRRPSCVVHNFCKHLLLLNHWANLDETWQGCSLGEALPKLFKRLNSNHNSGCHGNQKEKK